MVGGFRHYPADLLQLRRRLPERHLGADHCHAGGHVRSPILERSSTPPRIKSVDMTKEEIKAIEEEYAKTETPVFLSFPINEAVLVHFFLLLRQYRE